MTFLILSLSAIQPDVRVTEQHAVSLAASARPAFFMTLWGLSHFAFSSPASFSLVFWKFQALSADRHQSLLGFFLLSDTILIQRGGVISAVLPETLTYTLLSRFPVRCSHHGASVLSTAAGPPGTRRSSHVSTIQSSPRNKCTGIAPLAGIRPGF